MARPIAAPNPEAGAPACGPPWARGGGPPWLGGGWGPPPDGRRADWFRRRGMRFRIAAAFLFVTLVGLLAAVLATATGLFGRAPSAAWTLRTLPLALACAAAAGVLATGRVTRGLRRLRDAVERLDLRNPAARVPVEGSDEVAALGRAINGLAARLAETERVRRELFADVAHELRHPLAVLQGRLELLQDGVVAADGAQLLQLQDMALALGRLVGDLRDLSLADVGRLSLHPAPLDLAALLGDLRDNLEPVAAARGVTLSAEADPGLPPLRADGDRIRQVLVNLLDNALRHTPAGGWVRVRARREGPAAAIEVEDSGPGIPPEDLPRVFDRFYRRDGAATPGGSGLGLAIARSLVVLHGGTVSATSAPGRGTRFTVLLPLGGPGGS